MCTESKQTFKQRLLETSAAPTSVSVRAGMPLSLQICLVSVSLTEISICPGG